jgi:hypothetical protein
MVQVGTGDLVLVLGTKVYQNQNCIQAWAEFSTAHLVEVLNSVRNRTLDSALAIWKENPTAGDSPNCSKRPIEESKVTHIFNTTVYGGSANVVGAANETAAGQMKIDITKSNVHQLNLGTVLGDMSSTVTTLAQSGHAEIAAALKALAEEVATCVELGLARKDVLENLAFIGQQATQPIGGRKQGLLRAAIGHVQSAVQMIGTLSQAWATFRPLVESFFRDS